MVIPIVFGLWVNFYLFDSKNLLLNKLIKKKKECKQAFVNKLIGKTCDFLFEEQKDGYFEGYSENYVRLYLKEFLCTHDIVNVEIIAPFKDGALAKIKG